MGLNGFYARRTEQAGWRLKERGLGTELLAQHPVQLFALRREIFHSGLRAAEYALDRAEVAGKGIPELATASRCSIMTRAAPVSAVARPARRLPATRRRRSPPGFPPRAIRRQLPGIGRARGDFARIVCCLRKRHNHHDSHLPFLPSTIAAELHGLKYRPKPARSIQKARNV